MNLDFIVSEYYPVIYGIDLFQCFCPLFWVGLWCGGHFYPLTGSTNDFGHNVCTNSLIVSVKVNYY